MQKRNVKRQIPFNLETEQLERRSVPLLLRRCAIAIVLACIAIMTLAMNIAHGQTVLVSFSGTNGASPWGSPTLIGSTLYGMTMYGGTNNEGVLFSLPVPEPSTFALLGFSALALAAYRRKHAG